MALSPSTKRAQRRQQGIPNGQAELRLKYANDAIRKGSSSLEICLGLLVSELGPYKAVVFPPPKRVRHKSFSPANTRLGPLH